MCVMYFILTILFGQWIYVIDIINGFIPVCDMDLIIDDICVENYGKYFMNYSRWLFRRWKLMCGWIEGWRILERMHKIGMNSNRQDERNIKFPVENQSEMLLKRNSFKIKQLWLVLIFIWSSLFSVHQRNFPIDNIK